MTYSLVNRLQRASILPGVVLGVLVLVPGSGNRVLAESHMEKPKVKTGTLSSNRVGQQEATTVEGNFDDEELFSDELPPISGSVSRKGRDGWIMRLMNNTEDKYSLSVRIDLFDKRNRKVKSYHYSYTLAGGESTSRDLRSVPGAEQASLDLTGFRNLTPGSKNKGKDAKDGNKKG